MKKRLMKKKYFFGIFICLILLCSGVFLLTLENNQKIKIAPAYNQTVTLNVYFYGTYPYTGITGTARVMRFPNISLENAVIISFSNNRETDSGKLTSSKSYTTNGTAILSGGIEFDSNSLYNPGNGCNARRILRTKVYVTCDGNRVYTNEDYNWIDDNILTNVTNVSNVVVDIKIYFETFITINWNNPSGGVNSNGCNTSVIFNAEANQFQLYNSDHSLRNVSSLSPLPTRSNYAFSGYYPSGASSNDLVVNKNGKVIYAGSHTFCEKIRLAPLIPKWTPVYHIDTNILSPSDQQDYKSGTMTQSYNGTVKGKLTDQHFSDITADTTLTISGINPATGMYVSSITVDKGSVSITKDKEGNITGCTYTPQSSILGNPVGGGGWDAIISINMDYKDYDVTIKDGDEAVSNLADMTWINGATFNGTTYTQQQVILR